MFIKRLELDIIANYQPQSRPRDSLLQAAVALILRDGEFGTEILMMQRSSHDNDPWSGQMSFPGGKIEQNDESAKLAAMREADEEVGISLTEEDYIGQLDDVYGLKVDNQYSVHVACFVFKPDRPLEPRGNREVADLIWLPLSYLDDPLNSHDYRHPHDLNIKMPAVMINPDKEQILWGLSLRMISHFYALIERPLGVLSEQENSMLSKIERTNIDSATLDDKLGEKTRRLLNRRT
jgi:8-oxo-dGTP pyrophosphatase MutT (NUDIX family)